MGFNKPSPVQEGSQPYYQCLAASKVIQEEESRRGGVEGRERPVGADDSGGSQEIISGACISTSRKSSGIP